MIWSDLVWYVGCVTKMIQVTGHTATAVLGSQMMLLGGGNKRQFHSCRHVLMYDPIERAWSKMATRGIAPATLIYHR